MDQQPSYDDLVTRVAILEQTLEATREKLTAVQKSEQMYRQVVDRATDPIYVTEVASGSVVHTNPAAQKMLGKSIGKIEGHNLSGIVVPEEKATSDDRFERLINGATLEPQEYRIVSGDGKEVPVEATAFIIDLDDCKFVANIHRDISHRKKAEAQLKESERRYRLIMDNAVDAIFLNDVETSKIIDANQAAQSMLGKTLDEIKQMTVFDIVSSEDRKVVKYRLKKLLQEDALAPQEYELLINGNQIFIEAKPSVIELNGRKSVISIHRDITNRKRYEQKIKESEYRYRNLIETLNDGFSITDPENRITYVNDKLCHMLGYTPGELIGKKVPFLIRGKENREIINHQIEQRRKGVSDPYEVELTAKNGSQIPVLACPRADFDQQGVFQGSFGTLVDLSEVKKTEQALKSSEETARALLNIPGIVSALIDPEYNIIDANDFMAERFEMTRKELIGKNFLALLPKEIAEVRKKHHNDVIHTKKGMRAIDNRDGVWFDSIYNPVIDENGKVSRVALTARDITKQKETELKLEESLKEKNILIQEIHHRVKNNMQVISGLLQLQRRVVGDKKIDEILEAAQNRISAMALVHEKLYRSKSVTNIELDPYVRDLASDIFDSLNANPNDISFKKKIESIHLPIDRAIPIGLILNELITNSLKYAFSGGGTGTICVELCSTPGGQVELTVRDDGIGIPENIHSKTGKTLGLTLVRTLAEKQLHGKLDIKNEKGCKLQVRFPRT